MNGEFLSAATRGVNLGPDGRRACRNGVRVRIATGLQPASAWIVAAPPRRGRLRVVVPIGIGIAGVSRIRGGTRMALAARGRHEEDPWVRVAVEGASLERALRIRVLVIGRMATGGAASLTPAAGLP